MRRSAASLVSLALSCVACGSSSAGSADQDGSFAMPNAVGLGLPNEQSYSLITLEGDELVFDEVTRLTWQRAVNPDGMSWAAARQYCADLELGGASDWRLPSRLELVSLLDTSRENPSIDPDAFPETPSEWFWTDTPAANDPSKAWDVYFYFGYPDVEDVSNAFQARCVRGPKTAPPERYAITADTAHDVWTGLVWQRTLDPREFSLPEARDYCDALSLDGRAPFRVPSMKELETLVDEQRADPAIDPVAFPDTPSASFWSSSAWAGSGSLAWHVRFDSGTALYELTGMRFRARCVR